MQEPLKMSFEPRYRGFYWDRFFTPAELTTNPRHSMITPMIISAVLLILVLAAVLFESVRHASVGYQDEFGFHQGGDRQMGACGPSDAILTVTHSVSASKKPRAKRRKARTEKISIDQVSSPTYQI
jgi:hypothetical protein